jgi:two-component system sensor histidine kinase/response regulator
MLKLLSFIGLFILSISITFGQNMAKVDSLLRVIAVTKEDSLIIDQYIVLASEYLYALPTKANEYVYKALKISQQHNYENREAECYRVLGVVAWTKADLPLAMEFLFSSLRKYEKVQNLQGIANVLGNIGLIYSEQKDYQEAMNYYNKALIIQTKLGNKARIAANYNNIGDVYFRTKEYEKAIEYYERALELFTIVKLQASVLLNKMNISEVYVAQKLYAKALTISITTKEASYKIGDFRLVMRCMRINAEVYLALGEIEKAEKEGVDCVNLLEKTKLFVYAKDIYAMMSKIYKYKNNYEKAFTYKELQDSIEQVKQSEQITSYRVAYETEKQKKEKQSWEKERKLQLYFIIILLIIGLFIFATLLFTIYHLRRNKKINHSLQEKNREIKEQHAEISQQQVEIQLQTEQLRETNHVKDKLFSLIAHDLRNPINSLKGVFFLVENGGLSLEELQFLMGKIKTEVLTVEEMMSNLLLWAKAQLSNIHTNPEDFDITTVIKENFKLLQKHAELKQIILSYEVEESMIIHADINQVRVIIRNLVTNAIKFTEVGKITIYVKKIENSWQIEVKDTGIGMNEDQIAKLFHINTHFTTQGTAKEKGSGLGLLLCKEFIENHHGKIWVTSKVGEGTSFFFTLLVN